MQDPNPDPLAIGIDPRIRIRTKSSWIRNTGWKFAVWRIRDVYPGSRILIFTHSGSRIPDLGSRIPDLGSRISAPGSQIEKQQQKREVKKK
jgi:hypothetical protein